MFVTRWKSAQGLLHSKEPCLWRAPGNAAKAVGVFFSHFRDFSPPVPRLRLPSETPQKHFSTLSLKPFHKQQAPILPQNAAHPKGSTPGPCPGHFHTARPAVRCPHIPLFNSKSYTRDYNTYSWERVLRWNGGRVSILLGFLGEPGFRAIKKAPFLIPGVHLSPLSRLLALLKVTPDLLRVPTLVSTVHLQCFLGPSLPKLEELVSWFFFAIHSDLFQFTMSCSRR